MIAAEPSAMASLRRATREAHERTDIDVRRGDWLTSPARYAAFLTRTLRFQRLVEAAVGPVAASIDGLDYAQRRRSPLLEGDLAALGRSGVFAPVVNPRPARTPRLVISGPGAVLGCLYVVEGSTLGGRVLARWIESHLGYDRHRGASSFAPYGHATAKRWRAFAAVIEDRIVTAPDDLDPMLAAATATFTAYRAIVTGTAGSPCREATPG